MVWLKTLRLKSDNPAVRQRVVEKLAGSEDSSDTDLIVASLVDENALVRCAAVRALETAPDQACIQGLLSALRDESADVRRVAAVVLGRRGDRSVAWPLSALLNDPSPEVRQAVAHALRQLDWKPATGEELARYETSLGRSESPAAGGRALNPLLGDLNQDTAFLRRTAADALKEVSDPNRIAPWLAALTNPDPSVRVDAIHALDPEREEVVTVELLKMLCDRDQNVRLAAVQVVSRRPESPPAHFLPLLKDPHFEIRVAAVQFLGKFQNAQIADLLAPLLSDPDNDVRIATAKALGEICASCSIRPLVMALADEEHQVRAAAEYALGQIDRDWPRGIAAHQALGPLEALLDQRSAWVRSSILHILNRIRHT
jgi:HEAT repeat protein